MQEKKLRVGCIGCGNMGGALLSGWARTGRYELFGSTRTMARMAPLVELGVQAREDANDLAAQCDYIVLAVKPYQIEAVIAGLDQEKLKGKILISIAAGISLETLKKACGNVCPVVRCMPNTPAMVGEGVFALCYDPAIPCAVKADLNAMFGDLGVALEISEKQFTAFSALIGAGPAYVFDLMEGMVMAGVTLGFQHKESRRMVEALFRGCARMAQEETGTHLMALRDNVCSPAGLTIAGVNRMAADGLSGKLAEAVFAADRRGREMEG